ncbi:hypothetical protein ACO1O0_003213 [Amphichorda felina]
MSRSPPARQLAMESLRSAHRRPSDQRFASSGTRTYTEALQKLALLKSNRATTQLFDQPASPSADPNAPAIPEMLAWLRRAGYTPTDLARMRHIHVAGSKGKGSVCAYATAMLTRWRGADGSVGTYTSPHLVSPRERIAIDGQPVAQDVFAAALFEVWDRLSDAARRDGLDPHEADGPASKPFYFRFLTILAWHIFLTRGVRDVVVECGIGGEYDATNVLPPEAVSAAVVSQLGIDHVAMLGDTVDKIAWHKAGVFKRGRRAFTRRLDAQPGVMEVLRSRAEEKGAALVELDDAAVEAWGGVRGPLEGGFQKYNQALAVMAVREHLGMEADNSAVLRDTPEVLIEGLREAKLRGRGEMLQHGDVKWYLNGAHNRDSLEGVAMWLARELENDESVVLVFNQQDRDISELLAVFTEAARTQSGRDVFSHALFTSNDVEQPNDPETTELAVQKTAAATMSNLCPDCKVHVSGNIRDTVMEAQRIAEAKGTRQKVLVTGSMHLVGGVLRVLEPEGLL